MLLSWWGLRSSSMPTIWDPVSSFGTRWLPWGQCLMGQRWWWWTRVLSFGPTMRKKAQSQSLASVNMLFLAFRLDTNLLLLFIIKNTTASTLLTRNSKVLPSWKTSLLTFGRWSFRWFLKRDWGGSHVISNWSSKSSERSIKTKRRSVFLAGATDHREGSGFSS